MHPLDNDPEGGDGNWFSAETWHGCLQFTGNPALTQPLGKTACFSECYGKKNGVDFQHA
jgi:hypothetical protein